MAEIVQKSTIVAFIVLPITIPGAKGMFYTTIASTSKREKDDAYHIAQQ